MDKSFGITPEVFEWDATIFFIGLSLVGGSQQHVLEYHSRLQFSQMLGGGASFEKA
jgi:hypothetical protein